jgi:hypothetical protein
LVGQFLPLLLVELAVRQVLLQQPHPSINPRKRSPSAREIVNAAASSL